MILRIRTRNGITKKYSKVGYFGILSLDYKEKYYWQTYIKDKIKEHFEDKENVESFSIWMR